GVGLHRAGAVAPRAKVRAAVRRPLDRPVLHRRRVRPQRDHSLRREVPRRLQDDEPRADALAEPLRRLRAEVHARLRPGVRAAARPHARGAARPGDAGVPVEEPEVRDPDQLHHRRGAHADPPRLQPAPDGRPPLLALRGRHRLRPRLRPPEAQGGLTPMRFTELDVPSEVQEGIQAAGFTTTTPIQEAALPVALRGKDVAGQAQTGTGKTAAFLIATFTRLLRHPPSGTRQASPRALIIAPTRELVVQIDADARQLGRFTGLRTALVF